MCEDIFYLLLFVIGLLLNKYAEVSIWSVALLIIAFTCPKMLLSAYKEWQRTNKDELKAEVEKQRNEARFIGKRQGIQKVLNAQEGKKKINKNKQNKRKRRGKRND